MLNIQLQPGDLQGDVVPQEDSPVGVQEASITLHPGNSWYSPGGAFRLTTLFTVTITSTVPTACLGEVTVHFVDDSQLTLVATVAPNLTIVSPAPVAKPLPVMVTVVPPVLDPALGLTSVTVGVYL